MTLGFQGLTGVGYIEMAGGSPSLPPIWEAQPDPTIIATRSSMQDLLAGARTILSRADETLQKLEQTVSDNSDDISLAVLDVRKFTSALAANSDDVGKLVANVSTAATGIADATKRLDGIVDKSEALIAAIDPDEVRQTLANIRTTSDSFAAQAGRLGAIVDRADAIAGDAQAFSQHLPALGEKAEALVAARRPGKGEQHARQPRQVHGGARGQQRRYRPDRRGRKERLGALPVARRTCRFAASTKLDSMAGQGPGGLMQDATDTLASIKAAARQFQRSGLDPRQRSRRLQRSGASRFPQSGDGRSEDDRPARPGDLEPGAQSGGLSARRRERATIWRTTALAADGSGA